MVDILENSIFQTSPELLSSLLIDRTTSSAEKTNNIFWATKDYEHLGAGYGYNDSILPELITGENGKVVVPRVLKCKNNQSVRIKAMAEVFTPSWVCNTQNNLVDEAWFNRKDVFNTEYTTKEGQHKWLTNPKKIVFPKDKDWKAYVCDTRLEITCGEAPYIVSRYDTTTGESIPIAERIGLLDRKLRIISENTNTPSEWLSAAQMAYKNTYAYEWQGDSLLIARESMLFSFIEYYRDKFGAEPLLKSIKCIANIISWNVWQMDGLKGVIPGSCTSKTFTEISLFGENREIVIPCEGCYTDNVSKHNGIYCLIKDWKTKDTLNGCQGKLIRFVDTMR